MMLEEKHIIRVVSSSFDKSCLTGMHWDFESPALVI